MVSNSRVSQWAATSLYAMNARARLPSCFRYLARFSSIFGTKRTGAGDARGDCFAVFFGELKKLNLDFVGGGVTSLCGGGGGCRTGWELAFIWATMCGSRLTLKLSVNSSLLCSILVPFVSLVINPKLVHVQFKLLLDFDVGREFELWGCHVVDPVVESATHEGRLRG